MAITNRKHSPASSSSLGARGQDTRIILGEQYTDDATPNRGTLLSELFFQKGIIQGGVDDNVVALNINRTIGGNRPNTDEPGLCVIQGESNFDVNADGEDADNQWEVNIGESVEDDPDDGRRALAIAGNHTSKAVFISTCGTYTHWNSDRSAQVASITEAGLLQLASYVYITVGGDKNVILIEKNTPGSTWALLQVTSADKARLILDANGAGDGDISMGTSGTIRGKISGTSVTLAEITAGYAIFGDTNNWNGVYLRNGAPAGLFLEAGGVVGINVTSTKSICDTPVKLKEYAVAGLPSAATIGAGSIVSVSNGNAGARCLAMSDGSNWKVIALGATVSAT